MPRSALHQFRGGKVVLYQRAHSARWQARITLFPCRYKRISTGESDFDKAKDMACDYFDELRFKQKNNLPLDTRRFVDIANLSIKEMQQELDAGYGKVAYRDYITALYNYHIPFFGQTHIHTIDYKRLERLDQWRVQKMGKVPAKSTLKNHNAALNRVFKTALDRGWLHQIQLPTLVNKGRGKTVRAAFTRDEYKTVYRALRGWSKSGHKEKTRQIRTLLRDYVLILANTGIRHGTESLNLKWKNIEDVQIGDVYYLRFYVNGKTGPRSLIARHNTRSYLRRIQGRFDDLKDLPDKELFKIDEDVFRLEDGSRPKDFHGAFERFLEHHDLLLDSADNRRSLYSLRHTYATLNLENGLDYEALRVNMGTSIEMLQQHYSHITPEMVASRLAGKIDSARKTIESQKAAIERKRHSLTG